MFALHAPQFTVRSYPAGGGLHAHDHAQAVLPLQGTMSLAVGGAEAAEPCEGLVHDGTGVLIPAGVMHSFGAEGPNRFVVLDFDSEAVAGSFFTLDGSLLHLLRYLHAIAGPDSASLSLEVQRHATALLCDAVRGRTQTLPAQQVLSAALQQALVLMQQRFAQPLRVADIAQAVGLSASHLHAEFRRQLGKSPARHLADLRLDAAVAQLRGSTRPIAQIALDCGYSEQSALNRALRQRLGVTPAALRKA